MFIWGTIIFKATNHSELSGRQIPILQYVRHTHTHTLISNSQNHQVHSHVHGPVVCNIWHLFWLKELSCSAHSAGARFPAVSNTAWALCASLCVYVCVRVWKGWNTFFYFSIFFLIYLFSEPNASINSTSAGKCCCYDFLMEAKQLDPPACLWCRQRANACRSVGKSHLCVCMCVSVKVNEDEHRVSDTIVIEPPTG